MSRSIVYITPELPWPANQGSRRFLFDTARQLQRLGPVRWISRRTPGSGEAELRLREEGFDLDLDGTYARGGTWARALRRLRSEWMARRRGVPRELVYVSSPGVCARVAAWAAREPEALFVGAYWSTGDALARAPRTRRVLLAADVESVARAEVADPTSLERLRRAERAAFRRADLLLTLTGLDAHRARELLSGTPAPRPAIGVWPVAIEEVPRGAPRMPRSDRPVLLCYGHWSADFNRDGLDWFLREVWPTLRRHRLAPRLRVVGSGLTRAPRSGMDGIDWVGFVDDLETEFRRCDGVVIPLRWAGGIRYRLLEAQAHGMAVLCTRVAAEGSESIAGVTHLEAEGPEAFARALDRWADPVGIATLGDRARRFVRRRYGPAGVEERVRSLLASMLGAGQEEV